MRYVVREYVHGGIRFVYERVSEPQTDTELRERLENYRQRLLDSQSKQLRDVSILEFVSTNHYSAQQRRIQSDWNRESDALLREIELSVIFITPSMLMRGVITAVFWVAPPPFPYEVCEDIHEALGRAFEISERHSVRVDHKARDQIRTSLRQ